MSAITINLKADEGATAEVELKPVVGREVIIVARRRLADVGKQVAWGSMNVAQARTLHLAIGNAISEMEA